MRKKDSKRAVAYISLVTGSISLLSGGSQLIDDFLKACPANLEQSAVMETATESPVEEMNIRAGEADSPLFEERVQGEPINLTIKSVSSQVVESPNDAVNDQEKYSGSIEFSFRGITVRLENFDTESLYRTAGVLIALYIIRDVFAYCRAVQSDQVSRKAMEEAEKTIGKMINDLYDTLQHSSPEDSELIVLFDHREHPYNIFDDKVIEIRNRIESHWEKYKGKVDPRYLEAVQRLYECTILHPRDISLMKAEADKLRFTRTRTSILNRPTIKYLENLSVKLTLSKK